MMTGRGEIKIHNHVGDKPKRRKGKKATHGE
jgi:hypothetical protein